MDVLYVNLTEPLYWVKLIELIERGLYLSADSWQELGKCWHSYRPTSLW